MAEILNQNQFEYTGKVQPQWGEKDVNGQLLYPYLPNEELIEAVNLAIYLERPLLLKGEPGCG
ncbi:MAG: MoxR family ATPase, partial [Rivularia sp. ALOHA_DT_140]|nr:MoxR family ATPase [Rivularia sp. ALOHA_DT_140]